MSKFILHNFGCIWVATCAWLGIFCGIYRTFCPLPDQTWYGNLAFTCLMCILAFIFTGIVWVEWVERKLR